MRNRFFLLALPLGLMTAGCAGRSADYPSLAPRPIETVGFGKPMVAPTVAAADPVLDEKLAQTARRLDAVASGFAADAVRTKAAAGSARGQPAGTERWIAAQNALAALDDWRAQASAVLTDVEQLGIDRAATLAPDYPAQTALHDRATAEADHEATTITDLSRGLAPG